MALAHLDCARWLLLTILNGYEGGEILSLPRRKNVRISRVIARAHYDDEVDFTSPSAAGGSGGDGRTEIAGTMMLTLLAKRHRPARGVRVTG